MASTDTEVAVVGAGVAGLAAGLELRAAGRDVRVLDGAAQPGGVMQTLRADGYLLERGPNTFQAKAPVRAFLERHRAMDALLRAAPASRKRFLYHGGRLEPVPMDPVAFLRTPLLSGRGKRRLLREPFVPRGDGRGESVDAFVRRRLGDEALERLVAPFLTGVYAGDERRLGAEAVFGSLVEFERRHGSIVRGALAALFDRDRERGLPGTHSNETGLTGFAGRVARELGERLWLETPVRALRTGESGFELDVTRAGREQTIRARWLVLAAPAGAAAGLLRELDAEAAELLAGIEYAPVVSISLGVAPQDAGRPIEGFGYLVPRDAGPRLLGTLFMSQLFPGRAPAGRELLTCLLGGTRWPEAVDAPDDELLGVLYADLERTLGLRGEPTLLSLARWERAVPQPDAAHPRRVAALRERLAPRGAEVAGAWVSGVSVSDSLASGVVAAARLHAAA